MVLKHNHYGIIIYQELDMEWNLLQTEQLILMALFMAGLPPPTRQMITVGS